MKSTVLPLLASLAAASPALNARGTFCDQWGSERSGPYTVYNNLWGQGDATSGQQCTTNNGLIDGSDAIAWSTAWSWSGGQYNVKSYANVVVDSDFVTLDSINSMPSEWSWT